MKVRDAHATLNGSKDEITMASGALEVIADDGRALFDIRLLDDGTLEVRAGSWCRHNGVALEDRLLIAPRYANSIIVSRPKED